MKRLISKKIVAYDEAAEQFINECRESGKFNNWQMEEIYFGFENHLSIEEIKVYAKPEFNDQQMKQIRYGLKNLTMDKIELYAKPEFNEDQMEEIRLGFKKLKKDQVEIYANPKFNWKKMSIIRIGLEHGMSIEEIQEEYNL